MENVNKGGRRVNKHDETMGEKFFRFFHGFDTLKFIVDLSKDESFLKDLLDMLFFFCFASRKKGWLFLSSN
jgi:hypothetical protein